MCVCVCVTKALLFIYSLTKRLTEICGRPILLAFQWYVLCCYLSNVNFYVNMLGV